MTSLANWGGLCPDAVAATMVLVSDLVSWRVATPIIVIGVASSLWLVARR